MTEQETESLRLRAGIFKALGHPARLWIVELLTGGPLCVADLAQQVEGGLSAVSQHLAILRQYGLIIDERQGRQIYYSLAAPYVEELCAILDEKQVAKLQLKPKLRRKLPKMKDVIMAVVALSLSLSALLFALTPYVCRPAGHRPPPPHMMQLADTPEADPECICLPPRAPKPDKRQEHERPDGLIPQMNLFATLTPDAIAELALCAYEGLRGRP